MTPQDWPLADHPFLAFVNSVADDGKTRERNLFDSAETLVALLMQGGLPGPVEVPADAALDGLIGFREDAYAVLSANAAQRSAPEGPAAAVEAILKAAVARSRMTFAPAGLALAPASHVSLMDGLALSMLDLTIAPDFGRLSECRRCTRMFIDRGRGRGRRWCDMARCGNRAKAESFRARRRAVQAH